MRANTVPDFASLHPSYALLPSDVMPREQFTHSFHELFLRYRELRLGLLLQIFLAVLDGGERGAEDQVLDLDFALGLLVAALDDRAGLARLSAYLSWLPKFFGLPRYISARMPALRSAETIVW